MEFEFELGDIVRSISYTSYGTFGKVIGKTKRYSDDEDEIIIEYEIARNDDVFTMEENRLKKYEHQDILKNRGFLVDVGKDDMTIDVGILTLIDSKKSLYVSWARLDKENSDEIIKALKSSKLYKYDNEELKNSINSKED